MAIYIVVKVLNVQVPFYFKTIVDSMNVDFVALGGTVWTAAGSVVIACKTAVTLPNPPSPPRPARGSC